jgi:hypothetical protein
MNEELEEGTNPAPIMALAVILPVVLALAFTTCLLLFLFSEVI